MLLNAKDKPTMKIAALNPLAIYTPPCAKFYLASLREYLHNFFGFAIAIVLGK
jgi:hypothetical protein